MIRGQVRIVPKNKEQDQDMEAMGYGQGFERKDLVKITRG